MNGPTKDDRPPENQEPTNGLGSHHTTSTSNDHTAVARRLRLRRGASYRLPVLESGRSDPWWYAPPTAAYELAAAHLLGHGLTPAPNREGLQAMRRRGGHHYRAAKLIEQRWEAA